MSRVSMTFSNSSLANIHYAVGLAIDELHNQIATCPDVHEYEQELEDLEREKAYFKRLHDRIGRKLQGRVP